VVRINKKQKNVQEIVLFMLILLLYILGVGFITQGLMVKQGGFSIVVFMFGVLAIYGVIPAAFMQKLSANKVKVIWKVSVIINIVFIFTVYICFYRQFNGFIADAAMNNSLLGIMVSPGWRGPLPFQLPVADLAMYEFIGWFILTGVICYYYEDYLIKQKMHSK
jgi:hypothetical protein